MKPDLEKLLAEIQPHGPSPDLRKKVLTAVDMTLSEERTEVKTTAHPARASTYARWERRLAWTAVVSLLFAIGLNFLAYHIGEIRLAPFRPPTPEPRYIAEITETIESATDPETAQYFRSQLLAQWQTHRSTSRDSYESYMHYQEILKQATVFEKELCYVHTPQKVFIQKRDERPEASGDRSGNSRGDTSSHQWRGGMDHQFTG